MNVQMVGMSPTVYRHMGDHTHSVWEIVLNYQGCGVTSVGGEEYAFGPGSIICQPPDIPHNKVSSEGFRDIYIQPDYFPLARLADKNGVLVFQDDNEGSFQTLIFMAHRVFHSPGHNTQNLLNSLMNAMLQLLLCRHENAQLDPDVERLKNRMILSFTDSEFSVSELLDSGPLCRDHMRRKFRQATGKTPLEYLTELRMEYAKKLLLENAALRHSIAEIGAMCGYYDAHYFSRTFKKYSGKTPMEYLSRSDIGE